MRYTLVHRKAKGQSVPLIAIIIVVLVAMVGLSVDVGNTYAEQRNVVRSANAAALAGMNVIIRGNTDDSAVKRAIEQSLKSNGITGSFNDVDSGAKRNIRAFYYDAKGKPLGGGCSIGTCGTVPKGTTYLQVRIDGYTDTYFARVVGRPTLPLNAEAYAAQCSPTSGVYPIAINTELLNSQGFKPPQSKDELPYYGMYQDSSMAQPLAQRRVYLKDDANPSGSFGWLRWRGSTNSGSATDTAAALQGDGNLSDGFDEAPWPNSTGAWGSASAGYPIRPHELGSGDNDWVHTNTGLSWSSAINDAIQEHVAQRTKMILPIYDFTAGQGSNGQYRIVSLGTFLIRSIGKEQGKFYMDMVYLGQSGNEACNNSPPPITTQNISITGSVAIAPRAYEKPSKLPINYAVVLDTSGSTMWNFYGQAHIGGEVRQCGLGPNATYNAQRTADAGACNTGTGGDSKAWGVVEERRIYIAKQAIAKLIDQMTENDRMQLISFSQIELQNPSKRPAAQYGTTQGKLDLKKALLLAGTNITTNTCSVAPDASGNMKQTPDKCAYNMVGGTATASALKQARLYLTDPATPTKAPNNQSYKKAVLLVTDGVANFYENSGGNGNYTANGAAVGWENKAQDQPNCGLPVAEAAECQVGFASTTTNGTLKRPLSAMADQGLALQSDNVNAQVYVVALAGIDATGLNIVASQPYSPWYTEERDGTGMESVINAINADVVSGKCEPAPYQGWIYEISSANNPSPADRASLSPALSYKDENGDIVYGEVTLRDSNGSGVTARSAWVKHTDKDGTVRLTYTFKDIPRGTYLISARVAYKGSDGVTRYYDQILNNNLKTTDVRTVVVSDPGLAGVQVVDPLWLQYGKNVCDGVN